MEVKILIFNKSFSYYLILKKIVTKIYKIKEK